MSSSSSSLSSDSGSEAEQETLVLAKDSSQKKTAATTKHVSTKDASENNRKDRSGSESKQSKKKDSDSEDEDKHKKKSKKSSKRAAQSDSDDAMDVDDGDSGAGAAETAQTDDFVDDFDDEEKLLKVSSFSKPCLTLEDVEDDDIELVLVNLPMNCDYKSLEGKKFYYKKNPAKHETEQPPPAEMRFVKKEMVNDRERLNIHEEGELPVVNMVTLFPDPRRKKYVVGKPLRSLFQVTEVFDEEYLQDLRKKNEAALEKKMAEQRKKANAPDPDRLEHVPTWRFSPMQLPPRSEPTFRVRWGPPGSDIDSEAREAAPELPSSVARKYKEAVTKAASVKKTFKDKPAPSTPKSTPIKAEKTEFTAPTPKTPKTPKQEKEKDADAMDVSEVDETPVKTPTSQKKRKRSPSPTPTKSTPSTPSGAAPDSEKKKKKKEKKKDKESSDAEKPSKKKHKETD